MASSIASSTASTPEVAKPTQEQITEARTEVRKQYDGKNFQDRLVSNGKVASSAWDNVPAFLGGTNQADAQRALSSEINTKAAPIAQKKADDLALEAKKIAQAKEIAEAAAAAANDKAAAAEKKAAAEKEADKPFILVSLFRKVCIDIPAALFGALFNGVKSVLGAVKSVLMWPVNKLTSSSDEVSDKSSDTSSDAGSVKEGSEAGSVKEGSATAETTEGNTAE